jgi:2-polyprenyl-3-methyl-5-hydroxy-6-metoxy-1,4-benzoquinol methylase
MDSPNRPDWSPEAIKAFWNYFNSRQILHSISFSYQAGEGIVRFLKHTGKLVPRAKALDYGCGPGFLIERLLAAGLTCYGADAASAAVRAANDKFKDNPDWKGAVTLDGTPSAFDANVFDIVTCIETLEHLPGDMLTAVVSDVFRVLVPGGIALFTTPNNEDLSQDMVYCPFCQSEFHRMQHVRSFSAETLASVLSQAGFQVLFCAGLDFCTFQRTLPPWRDLCYGTLVWFARKKLYSLLDKIGKTPFPRGRELRHLLADGGPHLCAVASKPAAPHGRYCHLPQSPKPS